MKRARPDPLRLAIWLAIAVRFDSSLSSPAHELWAAWRRYALKRRAHPGTPRSFSNALRKVGCPWRRLEGRRTRIHDGMMVALSKQPDVPTLHPIHATDQQGRSRFVGMVPARYNAADPFNPQPLMYVKRGLLPGTWEPARVVERDGHWYLERAA